MRYIHATIFIWNVYPVNCNAKSPTTFTQRFLHGKSGEDIMKFIYNYWSLSVFTDNIIGKIKTPAGYYLLIRWTKDQHVSDKIGISRELCLSKFSSTWNIFRSLTKSMSFIYSSRNFPLKRLQTSCFSWTSQYFKIGVFRYSVIFSNSRSHDKICLKISWNCLKWLLLTFLSLQIKFNLFFSPAFVRFLNLDFFIKLNSSSYRP